MIRQLPNLVTLLRILLAPVIFRSIADGALRPALAWLILAAFTDIADGWLARRLHVTSRSGAYFDPIADKILLSGTYFLFWYRAVTPAWLPAIVFGRDALMLLFVAAVLAFTQLRDFPPTRWGKLSTAIQILAAFVILLTAPGNTAIQIPFMVLAAIATLWSALDYLRIGLGMLRGRALRSQAD